MGLLDGKIVIITGAGGGIGRCYALSFAAEGASVVVNDLGGTRDGVGSDAAMAAQVVKEIEEAGGAAVANFDSVATFEGVTGLFKTALDAYGRVDVLINNAGILRDKTLLKMEEAMWDAVIAVHLKGTFLASQAFARHVAERAESGDKGGCIINTSSYAGLIGNYGQSNYGAAKAGIAALTRVGALELERKLGIRVNCIAPMAKTRMTEEIDMVPEEMRPEHVAPMALFLASDLSKDVNGRIFGVHGLQLLEYRNLMTEGVTKKGSEVWTPAEIGSSLKAIAALPHEAPAPVAAAVPTGPAAVIDAAFSRLPEFFLPTLARSWDARLVFDIEGANTWTIVVKDRKCTSRKGGDENPTCVISTDAETYAAVLKGDLKPDKAFMGGKIKATNLSDVMKFASSFDMKKAKAALKEVLAKRAAAPAAAAAPTAPIGPGAVIDRAFELLPQIFLPARVKGWNANIHFDIGGATPWTVHVAEGACRTERGKQGEPTCVVTVDAETYAAVIKGELKPDKAFMSGKIKASNLGEMMKFATAFDMKKARDLAKQETAAPKTGGEAPAGGGGGAGPQALVDTAFGRLPSVFRPTAVSGWNARVHFDLQAGEPWTVVIDGGKCETIRGLKGEPTCVVTVSLEDYSKVLQGKLRAETAFMERRIKASNMGEMLKFGRAFDLVSLQGELAAQAPAEPKAAKHPPGLNRGLIGKRYAGNEPQFVKPDHIALFAAATQDPRPVYTGEDAIAPPLLAVRLLKDVLFRLVGDEALRADLLNLVHGEQDMEFLRPLRPWDLCATRAWISEIEDKATGQILRAEQEVWAGGELAVRVKASLFIRDPSKTREKSVAKEGASDAVEPVPTFQRTVTVPADGGPRYAEASLDNNPIHTDEEVATMAGFPGIILQGLCTMAMAGAAIIDEVGQGDPLALRRLKVRFSKPVLMGDVLTTEGWQEESAGAYGFRVVNQDGVVVVANGRAELVQA
ncbi:MAG: SDR family NAD(P)-dependent oxidoreductase [Planctomycetes bacterium]|nr:SDR family NAD(P)-dependent oxidoreductase [Planctomycetota bacterium]